MPTVCLTETATRGIYAGDNGCLYAREDGVERQCWRCGRWAQTVYRWAGQSVCGRHFRVRRGVIRLTTTFACRILRPGAVEPPAGKVLRRGDTLAVAGPPERRGRFDVFLVPTGGAVLVPRSRWAWA